GRLFENLEERVGGLFVGTIDVVNKEDPVLAFQRTKLRAVFEEPHLLNGDLAEGTVGREGDKVGVGVEEEGIVGSLFGGELFTLGEEFDVVGEAEVILFDSLDVTAEELGGEAAGEGGFANAFGTG